MSFIMPEIVVQKLIKTGIKGLRADRAAFDELFAQYSDPDLQDDYGDDYLDKLWDWFSTTKIPVIQAWSFNAQKIPSISIHLANETEDENKAAMKDMGFVDSDNNEIGVGVFTVMVDIGIHANKAGDHVLWIYYVVSYILYKYKSWAEKNGLQLHTFSASDYNKDNQYMTENIWTRWIRFRCTVQNTWGQQVAVEVDDVNVDFAEDLEPASSIAHTDDVDPSSIDDTKNKGLFGSRVGDENDEEDIPIQ